MYNADKVETDLTDEEMQECCLSMGRITASHTLFDLQVGRLIEAILGMSEITAATFIMNTVDSANKERIMQGISSIFKSDPFGYVPDYKPIPEIAKEMKDIASSFAKYTKIRNTVCHGTMGRIQGRVFVGSVSAAQFFKNDGGSGNWVFIDQTDAHVEGMADAIHAAVRLTEASKRAHKRLREAPDETSPNQP